MRASRTLLVLAALLSAAACTGSADPVAPANTTARSTGMTGSGNAVAGDSALAAERGGLGLMGSGN